MKTKGYFLKPQPSTAEINLADFMSDYDDPRETDAWRWVERAAWMKHVDNDAQAGVFEFLVNVDRVNCDDELLETMPELIKDIFSEAQAKQLALIIFYQG